MKRCVVLAAVQSADSHSYWIRQTLEGIREELSGRDGEMVSLSIGASPLPIGPGDPVLLIGYSRQWMLHAAESVRRAGGVPVLVSAEFPKELTACHGIAFDLSGTMAELLAYLRRAAKVRVALLGGNRDSTADAVKEAAFRAAAQELGMAYAVYSSDDALHDCVAGFLQHAQDFDAAVCANDTVALHLIHMLPQAGLRVPEDLFITGMGNSNLGRRARPSLTTVAFDYVELGRQAVRMLLACIAKALPGAVVRVTLPCSLFIRATTGDLPLAPAESDPAPDGKQLGKYYADPDVQRILAVEDLLQGLDEWDREILYGLLKDETYEALSERLNLSEGTVKYRLKKMLQTTGAEHRAALKAMLEQAFDPS